MGRQGVDLGDAGHIGHQARTHRTTRAHKVAVFQTALHQLLGGHIDHIVFAQDALELHVQPVHDELGRLVAVQGVALGPNHIVQLLLGVLQTGREQAARRQQLDVLDAVGDAAGVVDDHLVSGLLPQVGKLLQHLLGGLEVDGQGRVGIGELFAGQQDVAVDLILRLLKVDIAGGADGLVQLFAQADDGAVEVPQLLLGADIALAEHEHIVADGLYLQIIIEGRDALELRPVLMVGHGAEQLPCLAGRADDQPLAVGYQLRFGDGGHAAEVFQVGRGDELVQVFQAQLVLGQDDDVLGVAAGLAATGPQLQHLAIDLLEAVDVHLPLHALKERDEHIAHHGRVVGGAVVVEGGEVQMLRHDVQLVLVQLRQQVLRQDQAVDVRGVEVQAGLAAAGADEADVELRVMGRQGAAMDEVQEGGQRVLQRGRARQHGIGDAGEADVLRRKTALGIDKGLETVGDLAVFQHHRADLGDGLVGHVQTGGLDVEADDLVGEGLILRAVDGDAVVQVVDEVALHTVEELDLILGGIPGLGKRLHRAVVGDGDGRVSPRCRLLDHAAHIGEGVHGAHLGVEVELHALFRGVVLTAGVLGAQDVLRVQLQLTAIEGQLQPSLNAEVRAVRQGGGKLLGLLVPQGAADGDGAALVGDVEGQPPHAGAAGLEAFKFEDAALHDGRAHFQVQLGDGRGLALELLAQQHLPRALYRGGLITEGELDAAQVVLLRQHLLEGGAGRVGDGLAAL